MIDYRAFSISSRLSWLTGFIESFLMSEQTTARVVRMRTWVDMREENLCILGDGCPITGHATIRRIYLCFQQFAFTLVFCFFTTTQSIFFALIVYFSFFKPVFFSSFFRSQLLFLHSHFLRSFPNPIFLKCSTLPFTTSLFFA